MKKDTEHSCLGEWFDAGDLLNQLIVLLIGIVLLLANFGWIDASLLAYWPLIIVLVGIRALIHGRN